MRKLGFTVCMLALVAAGCTSDKDMDVVGFKTKMKVDPVYNAGKVALGEMINAKFVVENVGDEPLILSDVRPTCGCTVSDWSKDPIAPGEKGYVKATVNTTGFQFGPVTKSITMLSNTTPAQTTVVVKATIIK